MLHKRLFLLITFIVLYPTLSLSLIMPSISTVSSASTNWLSGWNYRQSHVIFPASGAGTNYQIPITVHLGSGNSSGSDVYLGGNAESNLGDVRFTASDGSTQLSYWEQTGSNFSISDFALSKSFGAFDIASDGTIYAGADNGSVYRSSNGGSTWTTILKLTDCSAQSIYVAKNGYVYLSTDGPNVAPSNRGIWRSTDGGLTWTVPLLTTTNQFVLWAFDEDSNGKLFLGLYTGSLTVSSAKIYRSVDNGANWSLVYSDPSARHVHDLKIDKATNYIYATFGDMGVGSFNTEYILRSTDGGNTWSKILTSLPQCVAICIIGNARFFGTDDGSTGGNGVIYRTIDDKTATAVLNVGSHAEGTWIRYDPNTNCILASFCPLTNNTLISRIYQSTDGGSTWSIYKSLPAAMSWDGSQTATKVVNGVFCYDVYYHGVTTGARKLSFQASALFWVKIPSDLTSSNATIYVYYGKSNTATTSNGANTFLLFDDFSGSSLSSIWTQSGTGTLSESGGLLTIAATSTGLGKRIISTATFGSGTRVISRASTNLVSSSSYEADAGIGYGSSTGNSDVEAWRSTLSSYGGNFYMETTTNGVNYYDTSTNLAWDNGFHVFNVGYGSGSFYVSVDGHTAQTTTNIPNTSMGAITGCWLGAGATTAVEYVDWIAVTKYVNTEPVQGSWGKVETQVQSGLPTFSALSANQTVAGQPTKLLATVNDTLSLSKYRFCTNNTGTFVNSSLVKFTSTPQTVTYNFTLNSHVGYVVAWKIFANDTSGISVSSAWQYITITMQIGKPTFTNLSANQTVAGKITKLSTTVNDIISLSGYKFCTNNSGTFVNSSLAKFIATPQTITYNFTLNSQVGYVVAWRVYANDTSNSWAASPWQYIIVTQAIQFFSIMQISDTQYLSQTYPSLYNQLTAWIVSNAQVYNLQMVVHTGDVVNIANNISQWSNANTAMSTLLSNNIPYCWTAGNHDQLSADEISGNPQNPWLGVNYAAFNATLMQSKSYWVSSIFQGKNTAVKFSYDGINILIINMEYYANSSAVNWMANLINSNPTYHVIVTTHAYLNGSAGYMCEDNGVWETSFLNTLNNYPRVFMTLNGHDTNGNPASRNKVGSRDQIFFNRQELDQQKGADSVRIYIFNVTSGTINVKTFVPYTSSFLTDSANQFTLTNSIVFQAIQPPTPQNITLRPNAIGMYSRFNEFKPGLIFSDQFETDDFSAWYSTATAGKGTIAISSTQVHTGSYSSVFTCSGSGESGDAGYSSKTISSQTTIYFRGYFYVNWKQSSDVELDMMYVYDSSGTLRGGFGIYHDGTHPDCFFFEEIDASGDNYHFITSPTPQPNTWYLLRVK